MDQEISGIDGCLNFGRILDIDDAGKIIVSDCSPAKIKIYKFDDNKFNQFSEEILLENTNSTTSISVSGNGKMFVVGSHLSKSASKNYGEVRIYNIQD